MNLHGAFSPPGDKSISHRMALMSLLAGGECRVTNFSPCADVSSSLEAVRKLGGDFTLEDDTVVLVGAEGKMSPEARIDCGNSGTTMRMLMGVLAGVNGEFELIGDESLSRRPMERVAGPLRLMGARVECSDGHAPIIIRGGELQGLSYEMPIASAQVKSAILLAGIQSRGRTRVVEPRPSRDHTERLLRLFGGRIDGPEGGWRVESSSLTLPREFHVPGDASSAAFFLCAAAVLPGSRVTAEGMLLNPTRVGFLNVLKRMGANLEILQDADFPEPMGRVTMQYSPDLTGTDITGDEIPFLVDEVPVLAFIASQAKGLTVFHEAGELRHKESDRLAAITSQLGNLGANIHIEGDSLVIEGPRQLTVTDDLDAHGDHRIAMTLKLAGLVAGCVPIIQGEDSIRISYPNFHQHLKELRT